jgi:hypothetical protein
MADVPNDPSDRIPVTEELLSVMRKAAGKAAELNEGSITPRALVLALLDDASTGSALRGAVNLEKLLAAVDEEAAPESGYDTLAFKSPESSTSLWLTPDAFEIFLEGARRAEDHYLPKHLAHGLAAQATQAPRMFIAMQLEPGAFADAAYRL